MFYRHLKLKYRIKILAIILLKDKARLNIVQKVSRCECPVTIFELNEGPRDCQNLYAITRFCFIEVLFHIFYYYWGKKFRSLYRELRYIEVL